MNRFFTGFCSLILILAFTLPAVAENNYFEVEFESFEATNYVDSLFMFEGAITNLQDSELVIVWQKSNDLPDDSWYTEICQLSRFCWPDFVSEDTILLAAGQVDTLQIKIYPHSEGVGETTLNLTVVADQEVTEELTFRLNARPVSIRQEDRNAEPSGLSWMNGNHGIGFKLPVATTASLTLYDIRGCQIAKLWNGSGVAGGQSISVSNINELPSGIYLLRLEADGVGAISRKITLLR